MAGSGLRVAAGDNGLVALVLVQPDGDDLRAELTWVDAMDLAFTIRAAALIAASSIGVEEAVWRQVIDRCEATVQASLEAYMGERDEEDPA